MATRPGLDAAVGFGRGPPEDLCLGFANTRYWRGTDAPTEELAAPADLLRWCAANAGLDAATLLRFGAPRDADPAEGAAALAAAIALREALYRMFSGIAEGAAAHDADVAVLNSALAGAATRATLVRAPDGWGWAMPMAAPDLGVLLAPVLWSAGDLLAGRRLARVRRCANDRCGWLFLDESKGATRRWCMMSACGNRAKAQRHYARVRASR
jgi:predicted RNA-binding Zn ribbon-like protein